jgi:hypothetical protein
MHSTNYFNTFIEVAEDCPVTFAKEPLSNGYKQTVATIQFDILIKKPYTYTSDEVLFLVHAIRNNVTEPDMVSEKEKFFSKGQPCFRSSPLAKRYGWGIHSNDKGLVALVALGSEDYLKFRTDKGLKILKAMRSKRA